MSINLLIDAIEHLELTSTPRKPPTEWWLCDDILEMIGEALIPIRERLNIQYWQDITALKDVKLDRGRVFDDVSLSKTIINRRRIIESVRICFPLRKPRPPMYQHLGCEYYDFSWNMGILSVCEHINDHQTPYKPEEIKDYPTNSKAKNKCSICLKVGHNKKNCPHYWKRY